MLNNIEKKLGKKLIVFSIIALLGLIVYSNSFTAPFTLDDFGSIVNNKAIRDLTDIPAMWKFYTSRFLVYITFSFNWTIQHKLSINTDLMEVIFHIAIGIATFALFYLIMAISRLKKHMAVWKRLLAALVPALILSLLQIVPDEIIHKTTLLVNRAIRNSGETGYHITNLIIHIFNAYVVYLIIRNILGLDYFSEKLPGKYKNLTAAVSALIFVRHPIQINAVTYIVQRIASLASMFYLLAVLFYIMYRIRDKIIYLLLTLLFTVAAMFTKENTITIPFMLCLIEFMFFLKDGKTTWLKRGLVLFIIMSTVVIIPGTELFGGYSQSDPGGNFKASTSMDRFVYFYTQMNVIILYIRLLFVPDKQCFDYSNDFEKSQSLWDNYSYISFAILVVIGLAALYNWRKNKLFSFGVLWFFLGLSVESSFISIKDVYFEHRLYFPLAGFIMAIWGLVFSFRGKRQNRRSVFKAPLTLFIVVSLIMIPFYSIMTLKRNYVYSDKIRLWSDVVKKAPDSDRGHSVLAAAYMDKYEDEGSKDEELYRLAEKEFKLAIEVRPGNATAHCNFAKLYYLKKNYEKCIEEAQIAVDLDPSVYGYHNLGNGWKGLGNFDKALEAYRAGYNLDKECGFILRDLADLYYDYDRPIEAYIFYQQYSNLFNSSFVKNRLKQLQEDNPNL